MPAELIGSTFPAPGRHQRQLRNYLLDPHFQLKYSAYLVGIALLLGCGLGAILWRTSQAVIEQSREAVGQGEQVVARGKEVLAESQKVSAVVQMNIVRDPDYSQNPALLEAFRADAEKQDQRLAAQQQALERQAADLKRQSSELSARQSSMLTTLCVALVLFLVLIGLAGIVVTHRVAGPVHKMKRQIRDVAKGRLQIPGKLRRGDELVSFFEVFENMVVSLRQRQEQEIRQLESAIAELGPGTPGEARASLERLRDDMKAALNV